MAKCPVCGSKQKYLNVFFASRWKPTVCPNCGTVLQYNPRGLGTRIIAAIASTFGILAGLGVASTREYLYWGIVTVIFIVLLAFIYPFFITLKTDSNS